MKQSAFVEYNRTFQKKDYFCEMKTLFRTKVCGVRYGHKKHSWDPICMKCEHLRTKKATAIQLLFTKKAIFAKNGTHVKSVEICK